MRFALVTLFVAGWTGLILAAPQTKAITVTDTSPQWLKNLAAKNAARRTTPSSSLSPTTGTARTINGDKVSMQDVKQGNFKTEAYYAPQTNTDGRSILAGRRERDYNSDEGTVVTENGVQKRVVGEAWGVMHGNGQQVTYDKNGNAVYGMLVDGKPAGVVRAESERAKYITPGKVSEMRNVLDKSK
jgi:hypothetical protein